MTNGIISKEDTQRLRLILAAVRLLVTEIKYYQDEAKEKHWLKKLSDSICKEKFDLLRSLQNDYDLILEEYGIRRFHKAA